MASREATRDISYASSARSRGGRTLIRMLENATGRLGLIKRAEGYEQEVAKGRNFWRVMAERYGLSLNVIGGSLESIPGNGPLILIANHPYGILDGLMMGNILSTLRGDFRILANSVFRRAEEVNRIILPISFDGDREALQLNVQTRKTALKYLDDGGAIGVFPGGTVATSARPFGRPMDPGWRSFTAKMVAKSEATVVPLYFPGHNSRLFQVASHLHANLRLGLLIKEFRARVDEPVDLVVGAPISRDRLAPFVKDTRAMMDFLRDETYALSPEPLPSTDYGYEFEDRYRTGDEKRIY